MNKKLLSLLILFSILIPSVNASSNSNLSITFIPEGMNQNYYVNIHNLNNSFNTTLEFNGIGEVTNLTSGIYYIRITSRNYNTLNIKLNLTQNTTLELFFNSNIIGYGIQNYDYLIFTVMLIVALFGILVIMVYYMKGVKIK